MKKEKYEKCRRSKVGDILIRKLLLILDFIRTILNCVNVMIKLVMLCQMQ